MFNDYGMESADSATRTLLKDADLLPAHENEVCSNTAKHKKCHSLTGSLLYLAVCARPDIPLPLDVVALNVHVPTVRYMKVLRRILHYGTGTVHYGLKYPCLA